MKQLYFLVLFILGGLSLTFAQTFSVETEIQNSTGYADDFDIYDVVPMKNETSGVIVLSWERTLEDVPTGWDVSNCMPCQCFPIGTTSGTGCYYSNTNTTGYANTHFYPNGVAGTGQVKLRMWDESSLDEVTVTFNATAQEPLVSVVEMHPTTFLRAYPNPFNNELNLEYNYGTTDNITVELVDLLGKVVLTKSGLSSSDNITINQELNSGIYLCVIKAEGKILDRIKLKKI